MRTFNKEHQSLVRACNYISSMLPKQIDGLTPVIHLTYNEFEMAWGVQLSVKEHVWKTQIAQVDYPWNSHIAIPSYIPRQARHMVNKVLLVKRKEILNSPKPWYENFKLHPGFKRGVIPVIQSGLRRSSSILPGGVEASHTEQYNYGGQGINLNSLIISHEEDPDFIGSQEDAVKFLEWRRGKNRKPPSDSTVKLNKPEPLLEHMYPAIIEKLDPEDPLLEQLNIPVIKPFNSN